MNERPIVKKHGGIGLIEVLISVLVISVGVMGLIGTQVTAKRAARDAVQRSTATTAAQDIVERMRTNGGQLVAYVTPANGLGGGTIASVAKECISSIDICSPADLAAYDLYQWEQALDGAGEIRNLLSVGGLLLPTGCVANDDGMVTVAVAWRGMNATINPISTDCGEGLSRYGDNDEYRQVLVLNTYISGR